MYSRQTDLNNAGNIDNMQQSDQGAVLSIQVPFYNIRHKHDRSALQSGIHQEG